VFITSRNKSESEIFSAAFSPGARSLNHFPLELLDLRTCDFEPALAK
jgi:hypothetical protein